MQTLLNKLAAKTKDFVTLTDLAQEFLNNECLQQLKPPVYLLEEAAIIPHMKARFYSISHDPFVDGATHTRQLKFIFSETRLDSELHNLGLCTQFMLDESTINNEVEIKTQFSS